MCLIYKEIEKRMVIQHEFIMNLYAHITIDYKFELELTSIKLPGGKTVNI